MCVIFRERQQQLDELSKELTKVQEEAELLKMKLRSMSKGGGGGGGGGKGVSGNIWRSIHLSFKGQ